MLFRSGSRAVGGAITFGTEHLYDKAQDKTTYMLGFKAEGSTVAASKVDWDINGANDILIANVWNAGRYSLPRTEDVITFKHQLSRIEVICKGEQNVSSSVIHSIWGNVTAITVVGVLPTLTYSLQKNTAQGTGIPADFALLKGNLYDAAQPFAPKQILGHSDTDEIFGAAMIYPLASTVELKITTENEGEKSVTTTLAAMERAKIHKITLTFNSKTKEIECTSSTIENWSNGDSGTGILPPK